MNALPLGYEPSVVPVHYPAINQKYFTGAVMVLHFLIIHNAVKIIIDMGTAIIMADSFEM